MRNKTRIRQTTALLTLISFFGLMATAAAIIYSTSQPAPAVAAEAERPGPGDLDLPADDNGAPYVEEDRLQDDLPAADDNLTEEEEKLFQETLGSEEK